MRSPDKLGLVKKSLRLLVNQLNESDYIALVVYAGAAGVVLESTSGDQKAKILNAIDSLEAGGSTNGGAGIRLAYNLAQQRCQKDGSNRVIIAADGHMNVGIVNIFHKFRQFFWLNCWQVLLWWGCLEVLAQAMQSIDRNNLLSDGKIHNHIETLAYSPQGL